MKNLKFTSLALLVALVVVSSCKPDPAPEPSAEEVQTALLAQTWNVSSVNYNTADETDLWTNFTVVYNANGSYTASSVSAGRENVWPSTGSWAYKGAGTDGVDVNTLIRDVGSNNETSISISVSETTLKMTFNYTNPSGRTSGTEGPWIFNMTK